MASETKPTVLDLWVCPDCGDVVRVADDDRTGWRCCNQEMVRRRALVLDDAPHAPSGPFMHPDGEWVSIGFVDTNDTLLRCPEGSRDRKRVREWCAAVCAVLGMEEGG